MDLKWRRPVGIRTQLLLTLALATIAVFALPKLLAHAPEPIGSRSSLFIEGLITTIRLTAVAGAFGLFFGFLMGIGLIARSVFINAPLAVLGIVLRGTPLLVQILFAYYALPALFPSLSLNEFQAGALALGFNMAAYNAEVVRAGILALPHGQWEASLSLGLSKLQMMWSVLLPQAFRISLPPLLNNLIALLKDSSLASSIALYELSLAGNRISSETFEPVPVLVTTAVLYLFVTSLLAAFVQPLERYVQKGTRR